ncbi:MAG: VOC family protein [Bdellovibrionaceae bacterium]|nr:VOC family protein [Bdellovibrionales bacterium]MCB9085943.1 VOC family protein [Pseudobdellovibrionaceae bacterium]
MANSEIGMFGWCDLLSTDAKGAVGFYTKVFSWTSENVPSPSGGTYHFMKLGNKTVGGMVTQHKTPAIKHSIWQSYFLVEDIKLVAAKAEKVGGKVVDAPYEIGEFGYSAMIQDPTGANFNLWQSKAGPRAEKYCEEKAGSFCWTELLTKNTDVAGKFYCDLFDWTPETMKVADHLPPYTIFKKDGIPSCGMLAIQKEMGDIPSHWLPYVFVDNCDDTLHKARQAGGHEVMPTTEIPTIGKFAVFKDTQGAVLACMSK